MIWRRTLQSLIFLIASLVSLLLASGSLALIALAAVLKVRGRDLILDSQRISFWPETIGALELHAWGAIWYAIAGVACMLIALPLALLLLEQLFLRLRPATVESA